MPNLAENSTQVRLDKGCGPPVLQDPQSGTGSIDGGKVHYNGQRSKPARPSRSAPSSVSGRARRTGGRGCW